MVDENTDRTVTVQLIETDHLRFIIEQENMPFVIPIASMVDAEYRQLSIDLEVAPAAAAEKLNIFVTNDEVNQH